MNPGLNQLQELIDILHRQDSSILHNGQRWRVNLTTSPDLPAGCQLLGTMAYYSPSARDCKCFYCGEGEDTFRDFGKRPFSMHNFAILEHDGNIAAALGKNINSMKVFSDLTFVSQPQRQPLLRNIELDQVIPCALHLLINVTKKMVGVTARLVETNPNLVPKFETILSDAHVYLFKKGNEPDDEINTVL